MDSRELVALIVGGAAHAFVLTNPGDDTALDNFVIGAAGGAMGGMLMTTYLPRWGTLGSVVSGLLGMVVFDYFLFQV